MSLRVDELTLKLADEPGTPGERAELARLLDESTSARGRHIELLEIEATLRGGGRPPSVAPEVMEAIRRGIHAGRARRGVLRNVPASPPQPAPKASALARVLHAGARWRVWLLGLLLVGSATAAAVLRGQHRDSVVPVATSQTSLAERPTPAALVPAILQRR